MSADQTLTHTERLQRELHSLMAPLRDHYAEVGREIEAIEAEIEKSREKIKELRKTKEEIRRLVRVSDPTFAPRPYNKNGQTPKKKSGTNTISQERLERTLTWLQENAEMLNAMNEGNGFVASHVIREHDIPATGGSQSTFSKILRKLHEQGAVRLTGIKGSGGAKHYKVVV